MTRQTLGALGLLFLSGASHAQSSAFESKVRPLLLEKCVACHGADQARGGVRLDRSIDAETARKLLAAVRYDGPVKMPPGGKLTAPQIGALEGWVKSGANFPHTPITGGQKLPVSANKAIIGSHWAFQRVKRPVIPTAKNPVLQSEWVQNPIDSFILQKLEKNGLSPNPPASRRELIRRVTYDLTGLPPTPEEVEAFAADSSPGAYPKLVDKLLSSPHYGEKWARHWLDLVRYAETNSYERDNPKPNAFRYRDYVIKSFNADKPYDRFITEQLAGDELPDSDANSLAATGFLRLGIWDDEPADAEQARYDGLDDVVTTVGQTFLGLTFDCARCHNHKIDPIPQTDYYKLVSFLNGINAYKNGGPTDEKPLFRSPAEKTLYERDALRLEKSRQETRVKIAALEENFKRNRDQGFRGSDLSGISYRLYPGNFPILPDFAALKPERTGTQPGNLFDLSPRLTDRGFGLVLDATLTVPAAGEYAFYLDSDDGARLIVGGKTIVERREGGGEGTERSGKVALSAGPTPIRLEYFEGSGTSPMGFRIAWAGANLPRRPLSTAASISALGLPLQLALDAPRTAAERALLAKLLEEQDKQEPPIDKLLVVSEGGPGAAETFVMARGVASAKGEKVSPGFPECLGGGDALVTPTATTSGRRLALARWIASPKNPQTARVMVNRIWQHHFGRGIVRTPSDYGLQGAAPTHPELLDYLADEFVKGGWSIKKLHRQILLSSAYQMSSRINPQALKKDPQNDLLARFDMRRLTAEEVRDSLLSVGGNLNPAMFGPSVYPDIAREVLQGQSVPGKDWYQERMKPEDKARRSVYIFQKRSLVYPLLASFDLPESDRTTASRFASVQPMQSLSLLNGTLANDQARLLAARASREVGPDPGAFAARVFSLAVQRPPTDGERAKLLALLTRLQKSGATLEQARTYLALAALNLNEFLYLD